MDVLSAELKVKWRDLNSALSEDRRYRGKLAGLFFGNVPKTFGASPEKILYIGKATKGEFADENASSIAFGCNQGAFWSFARRLSRSAGHEGIELDNLAWSNLCKIGTIRGNPSSRLVSCQRALAVETLQFEISALQPKLIVCVAADWLADDYLYDVLGVDRGSDGFQGEGCGKLLVYTRPPKDGFPSVLWMGHPERKPTSYLDQANELARRLLANG